MHSISKGNIYPDKNITSYVNEDIRFLVKKILLLTANKLIEIFNQQNRYSI